VLHEYAISPALLKQWAADDRDYYEFFREYGLGSPRIPSAFPKQKARKCRAYFLSEGPADQQSNQARRYLEMVEYLVETVVCRDGIVCEEGDWNLDVLIEDARAPFHVVLSPDPLDTPRNLTPKTMYSKGSAWNHARQETVARSYDAISPYLRDMLRLAKDKVILIDSYGWNQRAISFISKIIIDICNSRVSGQLPSVLVFYKEKIDRKSVRNSSPSSAQVKASIVEVLSTEVNGIDLTVSELRELGGKDVFHNRCILTEHGGVTLGHGIDVSEDENHSDEISLMEKSVYDKKWGQFVENLCFELISHA